MAGGRVDDRVGEQRRVGAADALLQNTLVELEHRRDRPVAGGEDDARPLGLGP